MGKTHKALENAEREYRKHLLKASRGSLPEEPAHFKRTSIRNSKGAFDDLKTNLLKWDSNGSIKSILFVGSSYRDGSYTYAAEFAASLTEDFKLRVLLIDLSLWTLSFQEAFKINEAIGLLDLFDNNGEMASKIMKVGTGNLYTVRWGRNNVGPVKIFESSRFVEFLKMMGKKFDYLILTAPPVTSFWECRALCAKVDGVVLVLKNGRTGRQVVHRAKKQLERRAGHKLLGVVLDRKRTLPPWFALITSIGFAVCLVFIMGFFLGKSWQVMQEGELLAARSAVRVDIKSQPKEMVQSRVRAQPDPYAQTTISEEVPSSDVPENASDSVASPASIEKAPGLRNEAALKQTRVVIVKKGDTLVGIISRTYGKYNADILNTVLHENPEIQDPDQIFEGLVLKLPLFVENR
jgi:Mrp family chromosome partitioning ATPase